MHAGVSSFQTIAAFDPKLAPIIESLIAKLQDGQSLDAESLAAAHPEHADQLRQLLPTVQLMVQLGESANGFSSGAPSSNGIGTAVRSQQLGDFRLVRELGRGGMGTVYEAEQISMGRRVALKVLPFIAIARENSLQRFRNEVRAAAALNHPHIVSVYSFGEERGVHYYAMQLVRGQTLAELIAELRKDRRAPSPFNKLTAGPCSLPEGEGSRSSESPTIGSSVRPPSTIREEQGRIRTAAESRHAAEFYRTVARLGIQAADALQHAHDMGVLHRDIKPGNLLLDREGELHITDFGLARLEADAGLTATGDIVGTLRYMAPEQALAKRVVIDQRADIYSLAATLYELLTLQPAFAETDRAELLKQIAFEEPSTLRKLDRSIPVDLETIVLKGMAKNREERYEAARNLGDDLRAYLEDRPIAAKPPTLISLASKWSRRHQSLMRMAGAAFVLLTFTLAVSIVIVSRAERQTAAALEKTRDLLYTADMTVAYQAFEKGWADEVRTILDRYRPTDPQSENRGFEWTLLEKLVKQPNSIALAGHEGPINEFAVFSDRRRLASVGNDGMLRIWDVTAAKLLRTITVCEEALHSVAISPDGRFVAAGNSVVYLCDLAGGDRISEIYQGPATVESIQFSPDGKHLFAGSRYEQVCQLSLDGQVIKQIPCASRVESLEYVADSDTLLIPNRRPVEDGQPSGIVQLWRNDLSELERELDVLQAHRSGGISHARTSPCERFVAGGDRYNSVATLFDRATGRVLFETPPSRDRLTDLAYSPIGKAIAIGYRNGRIEVFTLQLNAAGIPAIDRRPLVIDAHRGEVMCTRFITTGSLATCGADGLIRIWDLSTEPAHGFDLSDELMDGMQLSPDGELLLFVSKHEMLLANTKRGDVLYRCSHPEALYSAPAWSPIGDKAAVCRLDAQSVTILDRKGQAMCSIAHGAAPESAAFSPDGSLVAILSWAKLQLCRASDGVEVFQQTLRDQACSVAFSHDGMQLAYGGDFGPITVLDANRMQMVHEMDCRSGVYCLAFSPDDSTIASGHGDSVVRLWDARSGRLRAELVGHEQFINSVAFSPDGHTLLSAADDGTVRLWSVDHTRAYGIAFQRIDAKSQPGGCRLSLSADGRRLAVGYRTDERPSQDVTLWNLASAAEK
jgi:serine/threonine protein kinase/WD40 repeat protein